MKYVKTLTIGLVVALMVLIAVNPQVYMSSVTEGLKLFVISVLPAMLPFFFFSKILTSLDVAKSLSKHTKKATTFLFNAPDIAGYILIMSMLCGYPIGAKLISDSYKNSIINEDEAKSLIAFTSTSGPLFILGTIGAGLLKDYTAGVIILIIHYLSAIINGIIFKPSKRITSNKDYTYAPSNYDDVLSDAINSSIAACLVVGCYIAIFNVAVTALNQVNAISPIASLLAKIKIPTALSEGFLTGIVEMTRGMFIISSSGFSSKLSLPIFAFLVSFGGLSVILQSLTFLGKCKIKPLYFILSKLSQASISFILAFIVCNLVY